MNQLLKAIFTNVQLETARSIGAQPISLKEKISDLFDRLPDPLLSTEDIRLLLETKERKAALDSALRDLVSEDSIELSDTTQRPFDDQSITLYRSTAHKLKRLKIKALECFLPDHRKQYLWTFNGRLIRSIAKVDRLDSLTGEGLQREEIKRHAREIADGIRSGTNIPNSVILVFNPENVADVAEDDLPESFIAIRCLSEEQHTDTSADTSQIQRVRMVQIDLPYRNAAFDEEKAISLVDGQQRTAAISLVDCDERPTIYVPIVAMIAGADEAKHIFQVANNTQNISPVW